MRSNQLPMIFSHLLSSGLLYASLKTIAGVRLKALVIQGGEIPPPVKPNQQPVLSLGVEAVRSDLSVDKGVCEPQCESVKPISPVNFGNAEVETVP